MLENFLRHCFIHRLYNSIPIIRHSIAYLSQTLELLYEVNFELSYKKNVC